MPLPMRRTAGSGYNLFAVNLYARARRGPRGELAEQGAERPAGAGGAAGSPVLFFAMAMAMAGAIGGARWRSPPPLS